MQVVTEESTAWLVVTFKDREGVLTAPSSFKYRIDTEQGAELRPWTDVDNQALDLEQEIKLTPDDNRIVDSNLEPNKRQVNVVTIIAPFDENDQRTAEYKYRVENLAKIPKQED